MDELVRLRDLSALSLEIECSARESLGDLR